MDDFTEALVGEDLLYSLPQLGCKMPPFEGLCTKVLHVPSAYENSTTPGHHSRWCRGLIPGPGPGAVGLNSCTLDISTSLMDPPAGKRLVNFSLTHSISRSIHPFAISCRGRVAARFSRESKEWSAREIASHSGSKVSLGGCSEFSEGIVMI
jgi:hypothetical protein